MTVDEALTALNHAATQLDLRSGQMADAKHLLDEAVANERNARMDLDSAITERRERLRTQPPA